MCRANAGNTRNHMVRHDNKCAVTSDVLNWYYNSELLHPPQNFHDCKQARSALSSFLCPMRLIHRTLTFKTFICIDCRQKNTGMYIQAIHTVPQNLISICSWNLCLWAVTMKKTILINYTCSPAYIITFCVNRQRKMYCGHAHLCVCPQPYAHTTARTRM